MRIFVLPWDMRNTDLPLFEKHYADLSDDEIRGRRKPARDVGMTALEVGTDETQSMIARHNRFLLRYTNDQIRTEHATWLLGLSACSSNDEFTHQVLDQCKSRGLTDAAIAHLGLATDSIEAARYLTNNGVDWTTQTTQLHTDGSRVVDASSPHSALLDHHIPERSAGRYYRPREEVLVLHAATGNHLEASPLGFMQGVLESGQVRADTRFPTPALGLKDGQATWLSHCIASGRLELAEQALLHFKHMSQQSLDEGLLACAMLAEYEHLNYLGRRDEVKILSKIAKTLHARGANPDASFEFGTSAFEALIGTHYHSFSNKPDQPLRATTREWGLRAAMSRKLPRNHEAAYFPSPWPSPPEGHASWAEVALARHAYSRGDSDPKQVMMRRLFNLPGTPPISKLLETVEPNNLRPRVHGPQWGVIDALLESKLSTSAQGKLGYAPVMECVMQWGGCSNRERAKVQDTVKALTDRMDDWWEHSRLEGVLAWLNEDARALAKSRIDDFVKAARVFSNIKRPTQQDEEAIALAYSAFTTTGASAQPTSKAPRRSL